MEFLRALKNMTSEECREFGTMVVGLADSPRDAAWHANIARAIAKFETPGGRGMAEQLKSARISATALDNALRAAGMDHRKLIEEELTRRGDERTFEQYCDAVGGL